MSNNCVSEQNESAEDGGCVFPFLYEGVWYSSCTTVDNRNRFWCATTDNYDKDEDWDNCESKRTTFHLASVREMFTNITSLHQSVVKGSGFLSFSCQILK